MDHLPRPKDAVLSDFDRVPYVCQKEYDGGPFLTYPLRINKAHALPSADNTDYFLYERCQPTPIRELEAFFQAWLFFGLLTEIFGKLFNPTEFVCNVETETGHEKILSTSKLLALANSWITEVKSAIHDRPNQHEHIAKCLVLTANRLVAAPAGFDHRIKLSIAAIGEFLLFATMEAFSVRLKDSKIPPVWAAFFPDVSGLMRGNGWCPSEIRRCRKTFISVQALYYLSKIQKREPRSRHQACTDRKCIAYQIELNNYQTQHYAAGCACHEIVIDGKEVIRILENGQLPLLRINPCGNSISNLSVSVLESISNSRYVAISHVWADGLGNPKVNALPRCQLSHLYSLLAVLNSVAESAEEDGELLLWIDTLCCPVEPAEAKTMALAKMRRTYQQATHVLVLDASLQQYCSQELDAVETCVRIFTSGWMQRLWTLQEGAMATKLWFQFHDGPLDLNQLSQHISSNIFLQLDLGRVGLAAIMVNQYRDLRCTFYGSSDNSSSDLPTIASALRHRSVSVPSDEPLCIAALMNLDLAKVVAGPESRRMQELWSLMPLDFRGIPRSIIFHAGPKLREKGYRWAPATLLRLIEFGGDSMRRENTVDSIGIPTVNGLLIYLPGLLVSRSMAPKILSERQWNISSESKRDSLFVRDDSSVWYNMADRTELPLRNEDPPSPEYLIPGQPLVTDKRIQATQYFPLLDLIREKAYEHYVLVDNSLETSADGLLQSRDALLVKRIRDQDGVVYVESKIRVGLSFLGKSMSEMLEAAYQCGNFLQRDGSTQRLAEMDDNKIGIEAPAYNEELNKLEQKIQELATEALEDADLMKSVSNMYSPQKANIIFQGLLTQFFMGFHGTITAKFPSTQRWCVD